MLAVVGMALQGAHETGKLMLLDMALPPLHVVPELELAQDIAGICGKKWRTVIPRVLPHRPTEQRSQEAEAPVRLCATPRRLALEQARHHTACDRSQFQ